MTTSLQGQVGTILIQTWMVHLVVTWPTNLGLWVLQTPEEGGTATMTCCFSCISDYGHYIVFQ